MSVFFAFLRFVCGVGLFCHCSAGGVRLVGVLSLSPVATAFNWFSCPLSPRPPSPAGKGGIFSLFCRGLRPRHPGLNPRGTGLSRCSDCLGWISLGTGTNAVPTTELFDKSSGGSGGLFQESPGVPPLPLMRWRLLRVAFSLEPARTPSQQQIYSRKVLGGLGDSFKSPPSVSPASLNAVAIA